jgi:FAD/FMN-containing dehydrogenase
MVAAGLAGPSRASVGSVRDHVLGMTLINGKAEIMTFGGQVAKNVAGYDLARLMVGAMGILGVILEVSIKLLPVPVGSATLRFACDENEALRRFASWAARPLPINASVWVDGELRVRLSGARAAVDEACRQLGGERLSEPGASSWWTAVRDQQHPFFADLGEESLWRLSVPPRTDPLRLSGTELIEWQGGLRWWRTRQPAELVRKIAAGVQGHATLLRGARSGSVFQTPTPAVMDIHRRLKNSFDPDGILNRGRLYPEL